MAFGMADWGLDVVELPSQFINRHDPRIIVPLAAVRKVGNIPVMIEQVKAVFADGKVGVFMNRDCQAKVDQCPQAMQSRRIAEQLMIDQNAIVIKTQRLIASLAQLFQHGQPDKMPIAKLDAAKLRLLEIFLRLATSSR